jgi:hypothetical protein
MPEYRQRIRAAKQADDMDAMVKLLEEFGFKDKEANKHLLIDNECKFRKVVKILQYQNNNNNIKA